MLWKKTVLLVAGLFVLCFSSSAQEHKKSLTIELHSGVQIGWWLFDRGSTIPGVYNSEGFDNSHLSFSLPLECNLLYQHKTFRIGVGGTYYAFFDKTIRRQLYKGSNFNYTIADGHVTILGAHLAVEWLLFQSKNWTLAPHVKYGLFQINSIHPDRANFGLKTSFEIGINQELRFNRFIVILRPMYRSGIIQPKDKNTKNNKHHIYAFGLMVGTRFDLWTVKNRNQ